MSRTALPGFDASLRLLVVRERYAFTDIAMMFDVSRERVRQWCVARGIEHPDDVGERGLTRYRVWDEVRSRFRPESRFQVTERARAARVVERQAAWTKRRDARRAWIVNTVRVLMAQLGYQPTWGDVMVAMGFRRSTGRASRIIGLWGTNDPGGRATVAEIRAACRMSDLPRGPRHSARPASPPRVPSRSHRTRILPVGP